VIRQRKYRTRRSRTDGRSAAPPAVKTMSQVMAIATNPSGTGRAYQPRARLLARKVREHRRRADDD
jgi:hypothetical protein